jgi:hypothetical protein
LLALVDCLYLAKWVYNFNSTYPPFGRYIYGSFNTYHLPAYIEPLPTVVDERRGAWAQVKTEEQARGSHVMNCYFAATSSWWRQD